MRSQKILSMAFAALVLPLTLAHAGTSPQHRWDESKNPAGPNRCTSNTQCDGLRECSPAGWCQGEARPQPRLPPPPPPPPPPGQGRDSRGGWGDARDQDRAPRGPEDGRGRDRDPRGPELGRPVRLQSRLRGLVADIEGANRNKGASILAYPAKSPQQGNDNQVWELVPGRDGYLIRSRLNGLVLDIEGANRKPGARVMTFEAHGGDNQTWRLVPSPVPGYYYLQSALNGFVLDIGGARADGQGRLIAYPMNNPPSDNQLWQLVP